MRNTFKNILVIRPDAIGDQTLITPALSALRQRFPEAKITLLTRRYSAAIFEDTPLFDDLLFDEELYDKIFKKERIAWRTIARYSKEIRKRKFDLAVFFTDHWSYSMIALLGKVPCRLGDKAHLITALFKNIKALQRWKDITRHETEQNLLLLEPLGIKGEPAEMTILPTTENLARIKQIFAENGIADSDQVIGLHLGTGSGNKPWDPLGWPELVKLIMTRHPRAKIVLSGGPNDREKAARVTGEVKGVLDLTDRLSLGELVALIASFSVYVGVDTGPFHLAAALKRPMVAIFTSKAAKPTRWGPWKTKHVVVRKKSSCPKYCDASHCPDTLCQTEIKPGEIADALDKLLKGEGLKTHSEAFADWCKKTFCVTYSFFSRDEKLIAKAASFLDQMINDGYMLSLVTSPDHPLAKEFKGRLTLYTFNRRPGLFSLGQLLKIFVLENTNIIHPLDKAGRWIFSLAAILSANKLQIPAVLIKGKGCFRSSAEARSYYITACRSIKY
ncbi:MAG: glycosyltransferase family 9 protein [Candidatus Margulisbacteria bacterium]|nr:glycosyltransferase family 9 protein [Candidatus Margulisiibacteriota bacterium]